jgi:ribonuclease HI
VVVRRPDGSVLKSLGKALGTQTNNVAEYHGLIAALDFAAEHGIRRLRVRSDSLLLVQQVRGLYKVKNAGLKPLHERVTKMKGALEYFAIEHVRRELNSEADALANAALDAGAGSGVSAGAGPPGGPLSPPPGKHASQALKKGAGQKAATAPGVRVHARYSGGALHPMEPLALAEGEEVEITIRRRT